MVSPAVKHRRQKNLGIIQASFIFGLGYFLGHLNLFAQFGTTDLLSFDSASLTALNPISAGSSCKSLEYGNGWHSIEAFYGKSDHLERMLPQDLAWFSQVRQDEVVSRLLRGKRNGFFVDLAANDATSLSNTYSLEKKFGWNGLCIEPNPIYWANLTYRNCQVVAAVVGKERMEEVFFRFDVGDHGGIVGDDFDNGKKHKRVSEPRYTVTLREILERFNAPKSIDYLSLDVEGAEEFIMKDFPMRDYKVSLMTVERPKEPLRALLEQNGYKYIKRLSSWGESLWAHESIMDSLDLSDLDDFTPTRRPKASIEESQK